MKVYRYPIGPVNPQKVVRLSKVDAEDVADYLKDEHATPAMEAVRGALLGGAVIIVEG